MHYVEIKKWLKSFSVVYKINSIIRGKFDEHKWKRLCRENIKWVKAFGAEYDEKSTVAEVRAAVEKKMSLQNRQSDSLVFIFVGTDENQDNSGFLQALKMLGRVIVYFNRDGTHGVNLNDENGNKTLFCREMRSRNDEDLMDLIESCAGMKLVLVGQMMANFISSSILSRVSLKNIPIINISMDDKLHYNWTSIADERMGAIGLSKSVDVTLTTTRMVCAWYLKEGGRSLYFPLASDPGLFFEKYDSNNRDIDVLFIGNKYGLRAEIVEYLIKRGIRVEVWGGGWKNGVASFEKSIELSKRAKIILGTGNVGYCRNLFTMKLRDFDAPMSGAAYITHRSDVIHELYEEGVEIECYSNKYECANKIEYMLNYPQYRLQLACSAQVKVMNNGVWVDRLRRLFEQIGLLK